MKLLIDGEPFEVDIQGELTYGNDEVLIEHDQNAIEFVNWKDTGFTVADLLSQGEFESLKSNLLNVLNKILRDLGLKQLDALEQYHEVVKTDQVHHLVIVRTRDLRITDFQIDLDVICERVSEILGKKVRIYNPKLDQEIITLRISRPRTLDINPLHRDAYLDFYKDTINLWMPITGCNNKSSLPVIPGSHLWNEKNVLRTQAGKAKIANNTYHVPGIIAGPGKELKAIRPNPGYGQALIFTPYLVHGAAINLNKKETRMAFELRPCIF